MARSSYRRDSLFNSHISDDKSQKTQAPKHRVQELYRDKVQLANRVNKLEQDQKRILHKVEMTRKRAVKLRNIKEENEVN